MIMNEKEAWEYIADSYKENRKTDLEKLVSGYGLCNAIKTLYHSQKITLATETLMHKTLMYHYPIAISKFGAKILDKGEGLWWNNLDKESRAAFATYLSKLEFIK